MEQALELFEKLLAAKPDDLDRKRNVALCHKYLSSYFGATDPRRWHQHALKAAELDAERMRAEPQNAQAKVDYTFDISILGEYHTSQAQYDQALPYYEEALAMRRDLSERDRANAHGRSVLALTLTSVAGVHVLAGRHQRASPLLLE